ncbi:MAG: ABC transporter substrate-binding protein [Chitinivibrionales bacterium]
MRLSIKRVPRRLRGTYCSLLSAVLIAAMGAAVSVCAESLRRVTDLNGHSVTIPSVVNRVAVNGALAQMTIMLGCADKICATGTHVAGNPMLVKMFPSIMDALVPFGAPHGKSEVNIEELIKARPDVVFGENPKITSLGIPTLSISLLNFDDIKKTLMLMGETLGPKALDKAKQFVAYYDSTISAVSSRTANLPESRRAKVYYGSRDDGLTTEGKNTIACSWIDAAGGINMAARGNVEGQKKVSIEEVISWEPDILIVNSLNSYDEVTTSAVWKTIPAVRNNRVYRVPMGVYLWSVRSAEGALQIPWAAKVIQPDLFDDIDIKHTVRDFYSRFYEYAISDGEIEEILHPKR